MRTLALFTFLALSLNAQQQPSGNARPRSEAVRQAVRLDNEGKFEEARRVLEEAIQKAEDPAAKANAQRALAMSWAFAGDCAQVGRHEQMVIDYWKTREKEEPANAFYQQGEMANEAGRACIDLGKLDEAERWYRIGYELGTKEPNLSADRKALWDFRLAHAQARLAARRGRKTEAEKHVATAKAALDRMTDLRKQQELFLPYLTGYVAFYTGEPKKAIEDLKMANQRDVFIQTFMGEVYEKLGETEKAREAFAIAAKSQGHNPQAAYAHRIAKKKVTP
jgi:tetratricopeptide (TPR) repeat protein